MNSVCIQDTASSRNGMCSEYIAVHREYTDIGLQSRLCLAQDMYKVKRCRIEQVPVELETTHMHMHKRAGMSKKMFLYDHT